MVYAASNAALAVLEVRVHLDLPADLVPDDYVLTTINLGALAIEQLSEIPPDPAAFGTAWLQMQRTPILRVPSAIIPESSNLLLNPAHPRAPTARIVQERPFTFDSRLWFPRS